MKYICCVKIKTGDRKDDLCNTIIPENRNGILIDGVTYFVCDKHKKILNIDFIDVVKYNTLKK